MCLEENKEEEYNYIEYIDSILFWKRFAKDSLPEVIDVLEDEFFGDTIIIVVDSTRFEVSEFPEIFRGFFVDVVDVYEFTKSLQNILNDIILNDPNFWMSGYQNSSIETCLNFYLKMIRDYEYDLGCRRS